MYSDGRVSITRQIAGPLQANYAYAITRFFIARRQGSIDGMIEAFGILYASAAPQVQQVFEDRLRNLLTKKYGIKIDGSLFDPIGVIEELVDSYCGNVISVYEEFTSDDEKEEQCIDKAREVLTPLFLLLMRLIGESGGIFVQHVELRGGI